MEHTKGYLRRMPYLVIGEDRIDCNPESTARCGHFFVGRFHGSVRVACLNALPENEGDQLVGKGLLSPAGVKYDEYRP